MRKVQVLFFSLFFTLSTVAQIDSTIFNQIKSKRLAALKANSNQKRFKANTEFKDLLLDQLENKKPAIIFDSIPHFGTVKSPDKSFTIYNWNITTTNEEFLYFGFIKFSNGDIIELTDESKNMANATHKKTPLNKWYGALYYQIIPTKIKKDGTYYALLGWDGNGPNTTKKVIDVLYFDKALNNWFMGKPIFGPPYKDQYRFFLQYSKEVVVSLKYNEDENRITFDHLIPKSKGLEGIYEFYVPDMSFDAFEFRKDRWYFIQNVDARGEQTMENYNDPNQGERPR